jgi:RimJ/RimL family protein N-acetyltransferase
MAFEIFHAHRLWLDVKEHNKIARNLYEKQGFTLEGIFRDYVIYENKYENVVLMSILEEEYF